MKGKGITRHADVSTFVVQVGVGKGHVKAELEQFIMDSLTKDDWEVQAVGLFATTPIQPFDPPPTGGVYAPMAKVKVATQPQAPLKVSGWPGTAVPLTTDNWLFYHSEETCSHQAAKLGDPAFWIDPDPGYVPLDPHKQTPEGSSFDD